MKLVDDLAQLCGIQSEYFDIRGSRRLTSPQTRRELIAAMSFGRSEAEFETHRDALLERRWCRPLPPVHVTHQHSASLPLTIDGPLDPSACWSWTIVLEDGGELRGTIDLCADGLVEQRKVRGKQRCRCRWTPGRTLPCGYHRLAVGRGGSEHAYSCALIVAPQSCYWPKSLLDGRLWGTCAQLYSLRSSQNWGIGDFKDLARLAQLCGQAGGATLGLNPLHALYAARPTHVSPYFPSNRLFLNPLYLSVEGVPGFDCGLEDELDVAALTRARSARSVDYPRVADLKYRALRALYRRHNAGHGHHRQRQDFLHFKREAGEALGRHAAFEALQRYLSTEGETAPTWQHWPHGLRDCGSSEVQRFVEAHRQEVEFYAYLQWQADRQLGRAAKVAEEAGLTLGLYRDLAVSIDPTGSEAWSNPKLFAHGAKVGAPPDPFSDTGQDWGLAPWIPDQLERQAYQPFIELLRANMRHAGALRIDHVMQLSRLFWIPPGGRALDGAYVQYPLADLSAIVALESQRNHCVVIGEDLGTVPADVREVMAERRLLGTRVMLFEREHDANFRAPQSYPHDAIITASTHDLPTLSGFWSGEDLEHRRRIHKLDQAAVEQAQHDRRRDRYQLLEALEREGLRPEGADPEDTTLNRKIAAAVHAYLAGSPAPLMLVQLEDLCGSKQQPNLPGTIDEHPNWRHRLEVDLESSFNSTLARAIRSAMTKARSRPSGKDL